MKKKTKQQQQNTTFKNTLLLFEYILNSISKIYKISNLF